MIPEVLQEFLMDCGCAIAIYKSDNPAVKMWYGVYPCRERKVKNKTLVPVHALRW